MPTPSPREPPPLEAPTSLIDLVDVAVRWWRMLIVWPIVCGLGGGVIALVLPRSYTATTRFTPEAQTAQRLPAGLAGLAGQFGVSVGEDAAQSPRFYADVLRSRELMERVLRGVYPLPGSTGAAPDSMTLLRALRVKGRTGRDSLDRGVRALDKRLAVRVDNQTRILGVSVDARDPGLAAAVANRFVEYLSDFNTQRRQSNARARRIFVEQRVRDGETSLRSAEDALRNFYVNNRLWQQSPSLTFEEGRLRRQVEVQQEVYLTLRREFETARIEEVNTTPVFTVIDRAVPPSRKSWPLTSVFVALGLMVGLTIAVLGIVARQWMAALGRQGDATYLHLASLVSRRWPGRFPPRPERFD